MKDWLVVHSLESHAENPRMIGFSAKTRPDGTLLLDERGKPTPALRRVSELQPGDKFVYYCRQVSVIKGIYEIEQAVYARESQWPDSPFQFQMHPIVELEQPYDFRLLLTSLDLFRHLPRLESWGQALQGRNSALKPLTDHDYDLIERELRRYAGEVEEEEDRSAVVGPTSYHDEVKSMLSEIGRMEGRVTETEYRINGERIDVVWKRIEAGSPYAAFEVQIGGNFYAALAKLKHAWDKWNSRPYLMTTEEYKRRAVEWVSGSFHEIERHIQIIDSAKVKDLYEAVKRARQLRDELDIS